MFAVISVEFVSCPFAGEGIGGVQVWAFWFIVLGGVLFCPYHLTGGQQVFVWVSGRGLG